MEQMQAKYCMAITASECTNTRKRKAARISFWLQLQLAAGDRRNNPMNFTQLPLLLYTKADAVLSSAATHWCQ
jgi:hypothetical protein